MKKKEKLMLGDNIESLKKLPDNSVDSVVTDPPYGLSFMNKKWDYDVPSVELWKEVYRVLKPGGHVLSFGGTRTYHRMVVNIEDAGFEIRDQIMWLYGSGFPKSHNIGKSVDKINGVEREVVGERDLLGPAIHEGGTRPEGKSSIEITKGTSDWEGWGTALKPANEPICLARKPLSEKTIAANVLKHGTGGMNIDGCRVETDDKLRKLEGSFTFDSGNGADMTGKTNLFVDAGLGRFPANIILDEEAGQVLDLQHPKTSTTGKRSKKSIDNCIEARKKNKGNSQCDVGGNIDKITEYAGESGGASRFFYCAKVSKKERNLGCEDFEDKASDLNSGGIGRKCSVEKRLDTNGENKPTQKNTHPTVKPIALMRYLCRLITPPNGIILDPYMGSGSTGIAALLEGFRFCGMEMDEDYFKIAEARINNWELYKKIIK